jgi:hypothetical protein
MVLLGDTARPSIDLRTNQQRRDADERPLWEVAIVLLGDEGLEVVRVRIPHDLKGVAKGQALEVKGLKIRTWSRDGKTGLLWFAESLAPPADGQLAGRPAAPPRSPQPAASRSS